MLGSGSISVNISDSSQNLKEFEANYGVWGNNLASINSKLRKNGINKILFWLFMHALSTIFKNNGTISLVPQIYLFGSGSVLPVPPTILMSALISSFPRSRCVPFFLAFNKLIFHWEAGVPIQKYQRIERIKYHHYSNVKYKIPILKKKARKRVSVSKVGMKLMCHTVRD